MARYMKATYGDYWLSFHKTAGFFFLFSFFFFLFSFSFSFLFPLSSPSHNFLGAVIFFLNFVGVILGAIFVGVMEKDHFASLHSRLGFIAFGLLILQVSGSSIVVIIVLLFHLFHFI